MTRYNAPNNAPNLNMPNIKKTDYYSHGQLWMPEDISCGDIIKIGDSVRSHLILGFVFNAERRIFQKIHMAEIRNSRAASRVRDTSVHVTSVQERQGHISGVDLPAQIGTEKTNLLRLSNFLGNHDGIPRLERVGHVSPDFFRSVLDEIRKNHKDGFPELKEGRFYVPSLQFLLNPDEADCYPEGLVPYGQIGEFDRAMLLRDIDNPRYSMDGNEVFYHRIQIRREAHHQGYLGWIRNQKKLREIEKFEHSLNRRDPSVPKGQPAAPDVAALFQRVVGRPPANIIILPEERQVIRAVGDNPVEGMQVCIENLQESFNNRVAPSRIIVPKHLWQGRYLMLKINSLRHTDKMEGNGTAYRPCAIWNAYRDKKTGELAGFDLHPVTREEARFFNFKMPVHPLKTDSQREGVLVADCLIRVPLSAEFFHANTAFNFFELPPQKIQQFIDKKAVMSEMGAVPHVIGLETIPDDWDKVELPSTPTIEQFQKWAHRGQVRFDGNLFDHAQIHNRRSFAR